MSGLDLAALDAAARRRAQEEFTAPLVLEAGAGTGKTATLVARILAWCLGPGWATNAAALSGAAPELIAGRTLERVVAITFTEAAAAEMAERVGAALSELAAGGVPLGLDRERLGLAAEELALRSRALLAGLDRLPVSTIHAYCARLLAEHPLEAGLHPRFRVDAEGELLETELSALLTERLPAAYGLPGDADALALAAAGFGPDALAAAVSALVEAGVPAAALGAPRFDREVAELLSAELQAAVAAFRAAGGELLTAVGGRSRTTAPAALALLAVGELELPAALPPAAALGWLAGEVTARAAAAEEKLKAWARADFNKTEGELLGPRGSGLGSAAARLRTVLTQLSALDPERFEAARRLLAPLLAELCRRLDHAGAVTYQGLLTRAAALLAGHRDLAALLRRRMDQLLIDEFQDTDRLQCDLVRILALAGPRDERPGLFLVGDPKQSIYGFRSADLAAYDDFVAEVLAAGGSRERLAVSFRSLPAILNEVERVIAPVMEAERGIQPPFEALVASPARAAAEAGTTAGLAAFGRTPVEHWISWKEGERGLAKTPVGEATQLEARAVALDLLALRAASGLSFSEAAILVRSRGDLPTYVRALEEAGIPYNLARDRSYFRRREILDAAALVRAVLDPNDLLALTTTLRAPFVGVPDAALPRLFARGFAERGTELAAAEVAAVARELDAVAGEIPGLAALHGWEDSLLAFLRTLAALRRSYLEEAADLFVERLRSATLIEASEAARFLGAERLANLERFFNRLLTELDSGRDPKDLLRFLRRAVDEARETQEGRPLADLADAVQVMTIHAAKGLDFRHVYLAQAHKEPRPEGRAQSAARETPSGFELVLLGAPSPGWGAEAERVAASRRAEQVRLFYVALTRAKDRLVIAGRAPARPPMNAAAARSFAELLALRRPSPPPLPELFTELAAAGVAGAEREAVRWHFPALAAPDERGRAASRAPELDLPALTRRLAESAATRDERLARAAARAARPLTGAASAGAHEELAGHFEAAAGPGLERAVAMELGTAFHAALAEGELAGEVPAGLSPELAALLTHFWRGPLGERLRTLASHVVARELPVLLPPAGETGPLGAIAGAVDLVYREPASGALVVVDYKTDDVEGEELEARARAYAQQGALYCRALAEALDLPEPPRFELWFVRAGVVRVA